MKRVIGLVRKFFNNEPLYLNFYSLDIIRGLSALWVVIFHSLKDHYVAGNSYLSKMIYTFIQNGYLGVTVFFVLSGYCVSVSTGKNTKTPFKFILQRIRRIYPPYLMSILVGFVLVFLFMKTGLTRSAELPTLSNLFHSITLLTRAQIPFNGAYWSLTPELHFYIFMFAAIFVARKYFIYFLDVVAIIFFFNILQKSGLDSKIGLSYIALFVGNFSKFYAGILIYRIFRNLRSYAIFYDLFCFYVVFRFGFLDPFVFRVMILFLALKPLDSQIVKLKFLKYFFSLGAISYSLYLLHIIITPRIIGVSTRLFHLNNLEVLMLFLFIALPFTIVFTHYFYKFFEKPFMHRKALKEGI